MVKSDKGQSLLSATGHKRKKQRGPRGNGEMVGYQVETDRPRRKLDLETARGWLVRCICPDYPAFPGDSWPAPVQTATVWPTIPGNCIHTAVRRAGGPVREVAEAAAPPAIGEPPTPARIGRAGVRLLLYFDSSFFVLFSFGAGRLVSFKFLFLGDGAHLPTEAHTDKRNFFAKGANEFQRKAGVQSIGVDRGKAGARRRAGGQRMLNGVALALRTSQTLA